MAPRRNPDIVVAVLWEHGDWGNNSAKLAAQVINAFVTKQRKRDNNIRIADTPKPEDHPSHVLHHKVPGSNRRIADPASPRSDAPSPFVRNRDTPT